MPLIPLILPYYWKYHFFDFLNNGKITLNKQKSCLCHYHEHVSWKLLLWLQYQHLQLSIWRYVFCFIFLNFHYFIRLTDVLQEKQLRILFYVFSYSYSTSNMISFKITIRIFFLTSLEKWTAFFFINFVHFIFKFK